MQQTDQWGQPYIMKAYFGLTNPPVNIAKFAIGDGTVGSTLTFQYVPTVGLAPSVAQRRSFHRLTSTSV